MKNIQGFTLTELLVVLSIISILSSVGIGQFSDTQKVARDSERISDMYNIKLALETFYLDNGTYPGTAHGISNEGEKIGDNIGNFEAIMHQYLSPMPKDPINDENTYYYSYSPSHCSGLTETGKENAIAVSFNKAESNKNYTRGTDCGLEQNIAFADYNFILFPAAY